ncbi:MAG: phage major capsid protein [Rhodanobacteraceae bacterium]|nr:MAG: phage major capsid protein [Rhodanobacteraceae bacterium]
MKFREALRAVAPEAAKAGFQLECHRADASKSELLKDRANLRRLINTMQAQEDESLDAATIERHNKVADAVVPLISEINVRLDWLDSDDAPGANGASGTWGGRAVKDTSGRRIGTMLDAAALRDSRQIDAALRVGSRAISGAGDDPMVAAGDQGDLATFFRGVSGGSTTPTIRAALNEGTDSTGGYAVPSWVLAPIIKALVPASTMLAAGANMTVLDQPGDSFVIPAVDTIPTPSWRLELGTVNNAGPTFRAVTIVPRSLAFIFQVSRELLMDAPGMNDALSLVISQAFAKEIDRAGLMGSGATPEITGILNNAGVQTYNMGTNGAALAFYTDIVKARRVLTGVNAPAPTAIITSNREAQTIDLFADTLGQPLRRPQALADMQFLSTTQIPITGTQGTATDAANMFMGDFTQATFYLREHLSVMKLDQLYAESGAIGFLCHARVDLALRYPQAFCAIKGVIP